MGLATAIAAGVAIVVVGKALAKPKKKKNGNGVQYPDPIPPDDDDNGGTVIFETTWIPVEPDEPDVDPEDKEPGKTCGQAVTGPGKWGVWDDEGNCVIFWETGITDEAIRDILLQRYNALSDADQQAACAGDEYVEHLDEYVTNPKLEALVDAALTEYYSQPAGVFPPVEGSHYWVGQAWTLSWYVALDVLCGYVPGTS